MYIFEWIEHLVFTICVVTLLNIWFRQGICGVVTAIKQSVKTGLSGLFPLFVGQSPYTMVSQMSPSPTDTGRPAKLTIPQRGIPIQQLLDDLKDLKSKDPVVDPQKTFTDVIYPGEIQTDDTQLMQAIGDITESKPEDVIKRNILNEFQQSYMKENAQNPIISPSLRRLENEVVCMTASLLHGDEEVVGSMTSGGTESLVTAMRTYRERARVLFPHIREPEMVAPVSIHPAHAKAADYFGFKLVHVPLGEDCKPDLEKYEQAITANTICLLCSAPQYCHGVVDPVPELSQLAIRKALPLHVDACFGGFILPWVEKLGYEVPPFDFRLQGVTSMSADIHKYGCGPKGSSVVLFRNEDIRKYQLFSCPTHSGGWFASQGMAGTRPGGIIAASWITLKAIGQDGYLKMAKELMATTDKLRAAVTEIPGIRVLGSPHCTGVAIGSDDPEVDLLVLADELENKGWKPERQHSPPCINCAIVPHHNHVIDQLIQELQEATEFVKGTRSQVREGNATLYNMVTRIPDKSIVDEFLVEFVSEIYKN